MRRWWIGVLAGAVGGSAVVAQPSAMTAPATTMPAHDAAFWDTLMEHLSLAAQAQRDLKATMPGDRERLKALVAVASDGEIKAQLQARLDALNEQMVLDPEPLSLDFKDATLSEVAQALKKAMGAPIDSWPPNGQGPGGTFTIKCEGKGFWDVFSLLSQQHPLRIQNYNGTRLEQVQPGYKKFFPIAPGMVVFPLTIVRSHTLDPQQPEGKQESQPTVALNYALAVDPRLKIVRYAPPVLDEVKDDAGNNLLQRSGEPQGNLWDNQQGQCFFEQTEMLPAPANLGKKIVSVKGHATFQVQLAEERVDVDPKEVLKKPISLGEHTVTISEFKVESGSISFSIQSSGNNAPIGVTFVDANGQVVWSTRMSGGTGGGVGGQFVEPVKVQFSSSKKTKLVAVPFEMKDLPLP